MHRLAKYTLLCIMIVAASELNAQSTGESREFDENVIRLQQINTVEIPDGIAFKMVLAVVSNLHGEHERLSTGYIQTNMGLSEDRASTLANELRTVSARLNQEIADVTNEKLCSRSESLTNDEIYSVLDTLDDLSESISEEHLTLFTSPMAPDEAARLRQFLELQKANMGWMKLDHKKYYEINKIDPNSAVARICGKRN